MKNLLKIIFSFLCFALLLCLGLFGLYSRGDIGDSRDAMYRNVTASTKEGWHIADACGESVAGFLQYAEDLSDYEVKVYIKRDNAVGWFFRHGGSVGDPYANVYEITLENHSESIWYSLNEVGVARIEIDSGDGVHTIETTPGEPFILVTDRSQSITLYDAGGNIVVPQEHPA